MTSTFQRSGWLTVIGPGGKAHFFNANGDSACGDRKGILPGAKLGDLFTRPRRPTKEDDHICHYCAELHPRVCLCFACRAKAQAKIETARRIAEGQARRAAEKKAARERAEQLRGLTKAELALLNKESRT